MLHHPHKEEPHASETAESMVVLLSVAVAIFVILAITWHLLGWAL
jgi:hypothetical protein